MLCSLLAVVLTAPCLSPVLQDGPLTLEEALSLAREHSPALIAARSRLDEAAGRLDEASLPFAEDPVLETELGHRDTDDGHSTDWMLAVSQRFEAWGARSARIGLAEAELLAARAGGGDAERIVLTEVATTFQRLLLADQRLGILGAMRSVAEDIRHVAERRQAAGSSGLLELNLARAAAARAAADEVRARALRGELAALLRPQLGLGPLDPVAVQGELLAAPPGSLEELLGQARLRPDVLALEAEAQAAEAEAGFAESLRRSPVALRLGFAQEDHDEIAAVGLDIGLPLSGRGRGLRAAAAARASAMRARLAVQRAAAESEVRAAFDAHAELSSAAEDFRRATLPGLDENEALARQSWEAGAIDLLELLQVRRELLETRDAWLELQFDAAAARIRLVSAAGALS
jgi:cobalt-zinc-cadmium efflux system outer membrane protein